MRDKTGSVRVAAAVAAACLGCALGASVTADRSAAGGVRDLAVVQTVLCILGVGLWRAESRVRPRGAPAAAFLFVALGWGVLLSERQWPGGTPVAAFMLLWIPAFFLSGTALSRQNEDWDGRPAHVVLTGGLCLGITAGCCAGFLIDEERRFTCLLVALVVPCAAAVLHTLRAQRGEEADPFDACPAPCACPGAGEARRPQERGDCCSDVPVPDGALDDVSVACADLAEAFRLSAREREVMEYLARGHKAGFIAGQIGTAEATVRSHTRNIYRKMAVGSSEQLIQMVEARAACVRAARELAYAERVQRLGVLEGLRRGGKR